MHYTTHSSLLASFSTKISHSLTKRTLGHPTQRKQRNGRNRRNATDGTDAATDETSDRPFDTASFIINIKLLGGRSRRPSIGGGCGILLEQPFRQLRQLRVLHTFLAFIAFVTYFLFLRTLLRTLRALRCVETPL